MEMGQILECAEQEVVLNPPHLAADHRKVG